MAERNPSDDQAAFGVFPQLKRNRAKQDREAAKNVPIDLARGALAGVLGAPGDIESLVRIPYDYFRAPTMSELVTGEKTSKTYLPTSEDIEKRLPLRSETPVSKAATGLGILGGGFYTGPGSPLRVAGAIPSAVRHGAEEFAKASVAGVPHVIKPKGGNWLTGGVEDALKGLKRDTMMGAPGDTVEDVLKKKEALNNWVDRNLTNYVKKEMATPEDPVRKLAEEGITHMPKNEIDFHTQWIPEDLALSRMNAGFPSSGVGKSNTAKGWEAISDSYIHSAPASEYTKPLTDFEVRRGLKSLVDDNPWLTKIDPEARVGYLKSPGSVSQDLGFDHIMDVLRQDVAEGRIRPEQLNKVSMEQAVRRTYEYDQEMAKRMREAAIKQQEGFPVHKEYPEGYRWIELAPPKELPAGYSVVKDDMTGSFKVVDASGKEAVTRPANEMGHINVPFHKTEEEAIADALKYDKRLEEALKYEGNTMGHCVGGYCPDVIAGRSRIYSLRDAKGEPHVTVEVRPKRAQYEDIEKHFDQAHAEVLKDMNARGMDTSDPTKANGLAWKRAEEIANENPQMSIIQIKGKQNLRPIEKYDPYTQDFVKSGNWSDVGDLKNTGLISADAIRKAGWDMTGVDKKYFTKQEYDDLLRAEQNRVEGNGLKRGGRVRLSNNRDTMMLELNNKKMADGGYAGNYNTAPDMNDGGAIIQGAPFNKGGEVSKEALTGDDLIIEERPL